MRVKMNTGRNQLAVYACDVPIRGISCNNPPLVDLSCETRGGVVAKKFPHFGSEMVAKQGGLLQGGCCKKYP